MTTWEYRRVPLKFQVSDRTLFTLNLPLHTRRIKLLDNVAPVERLSPPSDVPPGDSQGFLMYALPVATSLPTVSIVGEYLCYVPLQYGHCFIDLASSFDEYRKKFSTKTRSTINRKVKKYVDHCGGTLRWQTYRTPSAVREFFTLARQVSKRSYQERLLDAGIPDSKAFLQRMQMLSGEDRVRAYILFDGERPVSYLYCPIEDGVLSYAYLGYDPDYMRLSVGTILHWLAIEQLFEEAKFRYFDFTEGTSEHKRLFATHEVHCANVMFVKRTILNSLLVYSHLAVCRLSEWFGRGLDRFGLRAMVRRFLRFSG